MPLSSRSLRLAAMTVFLAVATLTSALSEGLSVRFIAPPPGLPVSGETRVAVEATFPAGSRIARVELYIDDQLIATLERPPFEILWNAGPDFHPHLLRAVATDEGGGTATATLETPTLRVGQRESVFLVNLYVSVTDEKGRPVTDLRREDFTVYEDGVKQEISHFTSARQPVSLALLLDASNSMGTGDRMDIARKAAIDFIRKMHPKDRLLVMSFSDQVREVQPLTGDRKRLERAIEGIAPEGGTALYDALVVAVSRLKSFEGRRAVVLLSDGRDQAFKENAPGSLHVFEEAVDAAVRGEVVVYAIGLGARLEDETDLSQRWSLKQILETFAGKSGGRFYNPERAGQLSDVYLEISEDLGRRYSLAYAPATAGHNGKWRTIRVEVSRPTARVVTRPGYFAPSP